MTRLLLLLLLALAMTQPALAEWPIKRGDAQRTGIASSGSSNIVDPVPYWRFYLGGSLGAGAVLIDNLDGNAGNEVVYVTGGRLVAHDNLGNKLWSSSPLGLSSIVGLEDLDGDSAAELVANSNDHVYVFEASTGNVLWAEPDGEMGTIGGVRLADMDGNGLADILIQECACCGVNSGNPGFVYGFDQGFGSATQLWTFPFARCGGGRSFTVADLDGTPPMELLIANNRTFAAVDGTTGTLLDETDDLWDRAPISYCTAVETDGTAGDELACVANSNLASSDNLRRLFLLDYDAATSTFALVWDTVLAPNNGGDVRWIELASDLDDDGQFELVVSTLDPTNGWATLIFDAATGAELARIDGEIIAGVMPGSPALLLTLLDDTLNASTFDRPASSPLSQTWSLPDRAPLLYPDIPSRQRSSISSRVIAVDLDGDNVDELILRKISTKPNAMIAYSLTTGTPVELRRFDFPSRFTPLNYWLFPPLSGDTPQIGFARDDGFLTVFNDNLEPVNLGQDGGVPGIRIGGYYAEGGWRDLLRTPVAAKLDPNADAQAIIVADSRSWLLSLDAETSSWLDPPTKTWERSNHYGPSLVSSPSPRIACYSRQEPITPTSPHLIKLLDQNGIEQWSQTLPGPPLNDILPATLNTDGVTDYVFQWGEPSNTLLQTRAVSGTDGAVLWDAAGFEPTAGRQPAGLSIDDHDGNGIDDVYTAGAGFRAFSGSDGNILAQASIGYAYALITHYNLDSDAQNERLIAGSFSPVRVQDNDLTTNLLAPALDERPYPYAAAADCGSDRSVFITGSWAAPAQLRVYELTQNPGTSTPYVFAGGQIFASETDARNAGAWMGQLTSTTVHPDLTGDGTPTAMVGSKDGFLYAFNPCDGTLRFTHDFGAAVGEAVYADTNGDGLDEILVSVSDGYLYNLRDLGLPQPDYVWEIDPDGGITDQDIDVVDTTDTLTATWAAVTGATAYEAAVFDDRSDLVSAWTSTTETTLTLSGLALQDRKLYRWGVRALGPDGTSVDLMSDGVFVNVIEPPVEAEDTALPDTGAPDTSADTSAPDTGSGEDSGSGADTFPAVDTGSGQDTGGSPTGGGADDDCACASVRSSSAPAGAPLWLLVIPGLALMLRRRR